MFKTRYEIKVAENHYEAVKALVESLGIKIRYIKVGSAYFIGFKARQEEVDELIKKLYKYDIAKAVAVDA